MTGSRGPERAGPHQHLAVWPTAPTLPLFCLQPARAWLTVELTGPSAAPECCIPRADGQPLPRSVGVTPGVPNGQRGAARFGAVRLLLRVGRRDEQQRPGSSCVLLRVDQGGRNSRPAQTAAFGSCCLPADAGPANGRAIETPLPRPGARAVATPAEAERVASTTRPCRNSASER